ncbi:unnamed protein product, partial [Brassica oleracea]
RGSSSFTCAAGNDENAVGVVSSSDTAVFVSFDTAMAQLTNVRAAEVSQLT